jgi:hypothetical protein
MSGLHAISGFVFQVAQIIYPGGKHPANVPRRMWPWLLTFDSSEKAEKRAIVTEVLEAPVTVRPK